MEAVEPSKGEPKSPRRLKWSCVEYRPRNGDVLLEVNFIDRWGNQYRWAPEWENVMLLFFEALRTELGNKPDGSWAQVFKDLAGMAVLRAKSGEKHGRYPELVEELVDMVFCSSYLEEHYGKDPAVRILRQVSLGPVEARFKKINKGRGLAKSPTDTERSNHDPC